MTSSNLAICVGPSVLWSNDAAIASDQTYSKNVSTVMQILIEQYFKIYGDALPYIFCKDAVNGNKAVEEQNNNIAVVANGNSNSTFVKGPNANKSNNMIHQRTQNKSNSILNE